MDGGDVDENVDKRKARRFPQVSGSSHDSFAIGAMLMKVVISTR
jgi:hypothetical protein